MVNKAAYMHQISDAIALDYKPSLAVVAGQIVVRGTVPTLATGSIPAGVMGTTFAGGVWKVPKDGSTFNDHDEVYWNPTGNPVNGVASSGAASSSSAGAVLLGKAVIATGSFLAGDEFVYVHALRSVNVATVAGSMTADSITGSDANLEITGKAGASGAGGQVTTAGGAGDTNQAGGAVSYKGGAGNGTGAGGTADFGGGASGAGATGNGGATTLRGGAASSTNGTGGSCTVGGAAGTGTGAGGATSIVSGDSAGASGTVGALTIDTGAPNGGTGAAVDIAPTNATKIKLGKALDVKIGASTAATGSSNADAATLPAGTAPTYPTTAADGTKGVILNAADKVDGRMVFIGNGVSNQILKVYPPSGGTINGAAANAAFSSASGKGVIIQCLSAAGNTWLAW